MTMTDEELARIEKLCQSATPGPWTVDKKEDTEPNGWTHRWHWIREVAYDGPSYNYDIDGFARREDADFIAESRTAVPALVAEVRRLRAELAYEHEHVKKLLVIIGQQSEEIDEP